MEMFISDLDGTLLDSCAEVSEFSTRCLNDLLNQGMHFTIATARTPLSALLILQKIPITIPMILMNGAFIYCPQENRCLRMVDFGKACVDSLAEIEQTAGICGMLFAVEDGKIQIYLKTDKPYLWENYFDHDFLEKFDLVHRDYVEKTVSEVADKKIIYAMYMDDCPERLNEMAKLLRAQPQLTVDHYKDIYTENRWYVEVSSAATSKYHAVLWLKEFCRSTNLVGFGDGKNDLPLMEACDEFYAVENACPELKKKAGGIIKSNKEDGVARYLMERWNAYKEEKKRKGERK
ncbi:MAG: HAD hydrolase family protein [Coprococcus sp.]|nr:HAD hydrolase family protein [Coprococcus sp.]